MEVKTTMFKDELHFPVASRMGGTLPIGNTDGDVEELHQQPTNDNLDDVWGSDSDSESDSKHINEGTRGGNDEYSDIPRLREKHVTEGYRDGVMKGKAESVQRGFDEGYSLGAMIGLRIGRVLGVLEGLVGAVPAGGERERIEAMFERAREELGTKSVFGREYWGEDGVWTFEVKEVQGREVTFEDVSRSHPLVEMWEGVVEQEVERWDLDLGIMDLEGEVDEDDEGLVGIGKGATRVKKAADETTAPPGKIMGISKTELNW